MHLDCAGTAMDRAPSSGLRRGTLPHYRTQSVILARKLGNDDRQDHENCQHSNCHEEEPRMSAEEAAQKCLQFGVGRRCALLVSVRGALHVISVAYAHGLCGCISIQDLGDPTASKITADEADRENEYCEQQARLTTLIGAAAH